jgi:hypothetical protein
MASLLAAARDGLAGIDPLTPFHRRILLKGVILA